MSILRVCNSLATRAGHALFFSEGFPVLAPTLQGTGCFVFDNMLNDLDL